MPCVNRRRAMNFEDLLGHSKQYEEDEWIRRGVDCASSNRSWADGERQEPSTTGAARSNRLSRAPISIDYCRMGAGSNMTSTS